MRANERRGSIQSDVLDPFQILGLERRYDLDRATVQRAFLRRSMELHPDLAGAEDGDGGEAAELNRAKTTLESAELRADALLGLLGGTSKEADRALPPMFLQEMMELRETIEEDLASDREVAMTKWGAWAAERRREHERRVGELFQRVATQEGNARAATLKAIRIELNMWRYAGRLIEQLDAM